MKFPRKQIAFISVWICVCCASVQYKPVSPAPGYITNRGLLFSCEAIQKLFTDGKINLSRFLTRIKTCDNNDKKNVIPGVYQPLQQLTAKTQRSYIAYSAKHDLRSQNSMPILSQNNIQKYLLTSPNNGQTDRHNLYERTLIPHPVFRTESLATLKTEASPYFIQNTALGKVNVRNGNVWNGDQHNPVDLQRALSEVTPLQFLPASSKKEQQLPTSETINMNDVQKGSFARTLLAGRPVVPFAKSLNYAQPQAGSIQNVGAHPIQAPVRTLYNTFKNGIQVGNTARANIFPLYYLHNLNSNEQGNKGVTQDLPLKDDASFLDAGPSYDKNTMTLKAFEAVSPIARSQIVNNMKNIHLHPQKNAVVVNKPNISTQKTTQLNMVRHPSPTSKVTGYGNSNLRPNYNLLTLQSRNSLIRGNNLSRNAVVQSPIAIQTKQYNNNFQSAWSSHRNYVKSDIPTRRNLSKRTSTISIPVVANRNMDSDEVTADNLANIFSEIDTDAIQAVSTPITKKDQVPAISNNIQMIVTKDTEDGDSQLNYDQAAALTGSVEQKATTNLEQINPLWSAIRGKYTLQSNVKKSEIPGGIPNAIKQNFNLNRLRFGLSNGNYV